MKKNNQKRKIAGVAVLSALMGASIVSGVCLMPRPTMEASALTYCGDLFSTDVVTSKYSAAPLSIADFDSRGGVMLTADKEGASTRFVNVASGLFEIDYRVVASTYEKYDVTAMRFVFKDIETQDSFAVEVGLTSDGLSVPVTSRNAAKSYDNVRAIVDTGLGKGYAFDSGVDAITAYGKQIASSYCNHSTKSVVVGFDPSTMDVYARTNDSTSELLLLNLANAEHLAATGRQTPFSSFAKYSVDIEFKTFDAAATSASIMVYSMFGASFNTQQLESATPVVYAKPKYKAIVNQEYDLTDGAYVFDLCNGQAAFNGDISVIKPNGTRMNVDLQDPTFTPDMCGFYTLEYTPVNKQGVSGEKQTYYLEVANGEDTYQIKTETAFEDVTVGPGTVLTLPAAKAYDEYDNEIDVSRVSLSVTRQGGSTTVLTKNLLEATTYTFSRAGTYDVVWSATDAYGKKISQTTTVTVSDTAPAFMGDRLNATYAYGTTLALPEMEATLNGVTYPVDTVVYYPDGKKSSYASVVLDAEGEYKAVHTATIGGTVYEYVEYFTTKYAADSLFTVKGASATSNALLPDYADIYGNGIMFTASRNAATMTYKNAVDLSSSDLSVPLLDAMVAPETYNTAEFARFQLRLIDVYDEENYVTITMEPVAYGSDEKSSFVCGANLNYKLSAWKGGKVVTETNNAIKVATTMKGKYDGQWGIRRSVGFQVYYDASQKAIYAGSVNDTAPLLVLDLDDTNHVGAGNEWQGFTTGEAYVEIGIYNTRSSSASLMVFSVLDQELGGEYIEEDSEQIVFDDYDATNLPDALVGEPFPVFNANLYNLVTGKMRSINNVLAYRYENGNKVYIPIVSSTFTPSVEGEYFIEYFGVDENGNTTTRTVSVEACLTVPDIVYQEVEQPATAAFVGETVVLKEGTVSGGSGKVTVERYVQIGNEKGEIIDNMYTFKKAGVHNYIVRLTDYLGRQVVKTYPITVTVSSKPMVTEAAIPAVIISNTPYQFPEFKAYSYTADGDRNDVPVTITVNGSALGADRRYTPTSLQPLTVVYTAGNWSKTYTIAIKNGNTSIYLDRYFYYDTNEINVTATGSSLVFNTNATKAVDGKAEISFINTLPNFNTQIQFSIEKNNFSRINVYMTDSMDENVALKFSIVRGSSTAKTSSFYLNDGYERSMTGSFYAGNTTRPLQLTLSGKQILDYESNLLDTVTKTLSGTTFNGFPSGEVILKLEMEGITGEAALGIRDIWGQKFGDTDADYKGPSVRVEEFVVGAKYGDVIDLPAITVFDVLDGKNVTCAATINSADGTILKDYYSGTSFNKLALDLTQKYGFKVETYGTFEILIQGKDSSGNATNYRTTVVVAGDIPPTLTVDGEVKTTYSVGEKVTAPSGTATDLMGEELRVYAFIVDDTYRYTNALVTKEENKYTFAKAGTYTLVYYAYDQYGNYATAEYTIVVR